ncbi:MAG: TIGR04002 family protein [Ruminococcus sp.]|nr:TIGR04002 family protein [Ruminococcus sp.]
MPKVRTTYSSSEKVRLLVVTGLFASLVYVFTAYLHIPSGAGYTHAGDGIIYIAACILPAPYAAAAGAIGGALADGLSGYAVWIPATIVIKAVTALFFTRKTEKILTLRNMCGIVPSLIVCITGYALYEGTVMTKGFSLAAILAALQQIPSYCIQVLASSLLFIITAAALDKTDIRKKFRY